MKEQKKKLEQLVEGKAKVEKKLNTASSDLQSHEKKSREDQLQLNTLRQSLAQLSEREREVREVYDMQNLLGRWKINVIVCWWSVVDLHAIIIDANRP